MTLPLEPRIHSLLGHSGQAEASPPLLVDLRLWYDWHSRRGTLPGSFESSGYADVCREIGVPVLDYQRPWRIEPGDAVDERSETNDERRWTFGAGGRALTARWRIGPDGDYWQTEYPVKTEADLDILAAYLEQRRIVVDSVDASESGNDVVRIVELPSRPFSWMMLEILGWSDGLMLLLDASDRIDTIIELAETQIAEATARILASHEAAIVLSPDNLDGQFVSPAFFDRYLAASYADLSGDVHANGHRLIVHAGGPVSSLIAPIADASVDCICGVSGPPQGDAGIGETVSASEGRIVPWGGIPQDLLLSATDEADAIAQSQAVLDEAGKHAPAIVGIADHVPLDADIDRLASIAKIASFGS